MPRKFREVRNAGQADEQRLSAGRDSGYLWRASSFTNFIERDGGVYVEMETLGLTRRFPSLLGWVLEPIAKRLGRKSVEASLEEFRTAILASNRRTNATHISFPAVSAVNVVGVQLADSRFDAIR